MRGRVRMSMTCGVCVTRWGVGGGGRGGEALAESRSAPAGGRAGRGDGPDSAATFPFLLPIPPTPLPSLPFSHLHPGNAEVGALPHRVRPDAGHPVVHHRPLAAVDCQNWERDAGEGGEEHSGDGGVREWGVRLFVVVAQTGHCAGCARARRHAGRVCAEGAPRGRAVRVAPRAGNGKKTHAPPPPPNAPVYRVDVSTWPVTPAAMAQKAALDRVEAMAMACGEGADMAREKGSAAAGE